MPTPSPRRTAEPPGFVCRELMGRAACALLCWLAIAACAETPAGEEEESSPLLERRLSVARRVGQPWVPCPEECCLPDPASLAEMERRELLELDRRDAGFGAAEASPEALLWQARVELLAATLGGGDYDRAIQSAQNASLANPENPALLNELAVAYFSRYEHGGAFLDVVRALSAVRRALERAPELPEARFNHALFLTELGAYRTARTAWSRYVEIDDDPSWLEEAEVRSQAVGVGIEEDGEWPELRLRRAAEAGRLRDVERWVEKSRSRAREAAFGWLAEWGGAWLESGRGEGSLRAARVVGRVLVELGGDASVRDAVATIETSRDLRLKALASAYRGFGAGRAAYGRGLFGVALEHFRASRSELEPLATPLEGWLRVAEGAALYRVGAYAEAEAVLPNEVPGFLDRYPALRGRTEWVRASIDAVQSRPGDALREYSRAIQAYQVAGEEDSASSVRIRQAGLLTDQGAHRDAWEVWERVLPRSTNFSEVLEVRSVFETAAASAHALGLVWAALDLQREALRWARLSQDRVAVAEALRWLAEPALELGLTERVERLLDEGRRLAEDIPDDGQRILVEADLGVLQARLIALREPVEASAVLTRVLEEHRRMGVLFTAPRLLLERTLLLRRSGDILKARSSIGAALEAVEDRRKSSYGVRHRVLYLREARAVYEQAADLAASLERDGEAFVHADALKGRSLLDLLSVASDERSVTKDLQVVGSATSVADLLRILPPEWTLVSYLLLPDKVLISIVDRGGVHTVPVPVTVEAVTRQVERLRDSVLRDDDQAWEEAAEALGAWLTRPIERWLPVGGTLVLIPDGPLHGLPFDLLPDPVTGDRLGRRTLFIAPSASLVVRLLERRKTRSGQALRPLIVAGGGLPAAESEAREIARLYSRPRLVLSDEGAPPDLFAALEKADLFHFSGHTGSDGGLRGAFLLLDAEGSTAERIGAEDVLGLDLAELSAAILSSCDSGRSRGGDEGLTGLAWAFLAAGVPSVVATLWKVDDRAARAFGVELHRALRAGSPLPEALRKAKGALATNSDPALSRPRVWAAFELIGISSDEGDVQRR